MSKRFLAFVAALLTLSAVVGVALAADPDEGTLSLEERQLTWTGEATGQTVLYPEPRVECTIGLTSQCDEYTLTVDVDPAHWASNAGGAEVLIAWEDAESDFDLYVYDGNELVGESATSGTTSERVFLPSPSRDAGPYRVLVSAFDTEAGSTYGGGVRLESRTSVPDPATGGEVPDERVSAPCVDGQAGPFPCSNVDLAAFVPASELGASRPLPADVPATIADLVNDGLNDIWGWTDPETKREYALVGKTDGVAFVDVTEPTAPVYRGSLVSRQSLAELVPIDTIFKIWRDLKVYRDHVYIGSEEPGHGLQVFDLTKLRGEQPATGWTSDAGYDGFGNSHNIAINEDTGFLYAIGTNTCEGGAHIVDIREPKEPKEAGCVSEDGYTHDTQCVLYDGPDATFAGREICFDSNEDSITIVDVTDKSAPRQLARLGYEGSAYTHQGWLTKDKKRFLVNDELDEQDNGVPTTTRVFDVEQLNAPSLVGTYSAQVGSIDHNLYVKEDTVYEANYRSGLRVLDARAASEGKLSEIGFFDVYPADDDPEFNGAWSNYPYFPSGTVVVSGIEQGLFVLRPSAAAGGTTGRLSPPEGPGGTGGPSESGNPGDTGNPRGTGGTETPTPTGSATPTPADPAAGPATAAGTSATGGPAAGTPAATSPTAGTGATACAATAGLRTVGVQPLGSRGGLELELKATAPVDVDVFQTAVGRRVVAERRVARFVAQNDDVRWDGRATERNRTVTDGVYVARFTTRTGGQTDVRRVVIKRAGGRWVRQADHHRRSFCDLLRTFKLGRPVFGGTTGKPLDIAVRATQDTAAVVTVLRGSRVVKRFERKATASRTLRLRVPAEGLRRGVHRVRVTLTRDGRRVTSTISAERL